MANEAAAELGDVQVGACCTRLLRQHLGKGMWQQWQQGAAAQPGGNDIVLQGNHHTVAGRPTLAPPRPCPYPPPSLQRQRAAAIFAKGCRLEYMFFDGAYRQEQWPL